MPNSDPRASRDAHFQVLRAHDEETRRLVEEHRGALDELKNQRRELRLAAAHSAGQLGLQYQSESNTFIRFVSALNDEVVLPEIVERPIIEPNAPSSPIESPSLPPIEFKPTPTEKRQGWMSVAIDAFLWVLVLPVGGFVGIGLATLAGFQWQRETSVFWMSILFGFAVVAGLKLLFTFVWGMLGREKALGNPRAGLMTTAILASVGGCALDAHLGASALMQYSQMRSFRAEDALPYGQCFWLALAVTSPLLLASAARAFKKGQHEPSIEERENAQMARERHEAERRILELGEQSRRQAEALETERIRQFELAQIWSEESHRERLDVARQTYEARKAIEAKRDEDWADLRSMAEFKCLQGLISQIDVVSNEIKERERDLVNLKISRGYEKSSRANGKSPPLIEEQEGGSVELAMLDGAEGAGEEEGASAFVS